jgi:hypothetical protein
VRLGFAAPDEPPTSAGGGSAPPEPTAGERWLRGGDAALSALGEGLDGRRAPALLVTASSAEALRRAMALCKDHLAAVRADYTRWCGRRRGVRDAPRDGPREREAPQAGAGRGAWTGGGAGRAQATLADFIKPARPRGAAAGRGAGRREATAGAGAD